MSQEGRVSPGMNKNTKAQRQMSKLTFKSHVYQLDANKDLEAKVEDKGNEEPVIIETH